MVDFFTKWVVVADQIHSNQGSNFENRLFHELYEASGVKKTRICIPPGNVTELLGSFPSEVVFRKAHKIIFPNAPVALEPKKSAHSQHLIPLS